MSLLEAARPAAQRLRSSDGPVELWAHATADGVAAAAILAKALIRTGRPFHCRFPDVANPGGAAAMDEEPPSVRVLLATPAPRGLPEPAQFPLAIGPYLPEEIEIPSAAPRLNPLESGLAPGHACTASTTLALALALDDRNWETAPWAIAGALATGTGPGLSGWNEYVHREAKRRGLVEEHPLLALEDAPLLDVLAFPHGPLGGLLEPGYDSARRFLAKHRLAPEASPHELAQADRQHLASVLAMAYLRSNRPPQELARLFVPTPSLLLPEPLPVVRVVSLLDAGARQQDAGLGLGYLLGDASARPLLEAMLSTHQQRLRRALQPLVEPGVPADVALAWLKAESPADVDLVARLGARRVPSATRITAAYAEAGTTVHVYAVAPPALASRGFHLGRAVSEAAQSVGGRGHGHYDSARATVGHDRLDALRRAVEDSLARKAVEASS